MATLWLIVVIIGLASAVPSVVPAVARHKDPYTTYADSSPQARAGTRRNYCFGPGYRQVTAIVKDAAAGQLEQLQLWNAWLGGAFDGFVNDAFVVIGGWFGVVLGVLTSVGVLIIYAFLMVGTMVLGFGCIALVAGLLFVGQFLVMAGFFLVFSILWLIDRGLLALRSVQARCPNCKQRSVVPAFVCPTCGQLHEELTPGPYGVLFRRCSCKTQLATMYLTGRSRYKAVCPRCQSAVAASDARQFGVQLVGAVASGKSAFLAAFWHTYLARVGRTPGLSLRMEPAAAFAELEQWYQAGEAPSTSALNSPMYSVVHSFGDKTPVQMTIYDIAGEAFTMQTLAVRQQQFGYCEGIVFAIDPTAEPQLAAEAIISFVEEFDALTGGRASELSAVPVVAMITKADLFKREIGLPKTKAIYTTDPRPYASPDGTVSLDDVRNGLCREFLLQHGFSNAVNLLDGQFGLLHFYAVSAIGDAPAPGKPYSPWGVLEPIGWLIQCHGEGLHGVLPQLLAGELSGVPEIKRTLIPLPWR